ncbi:MAG: DUF3795 domain-containing protein [Candidatus Hermodarchaeota archaeon]
MKNRYDAYCGLYCGACEILLMNELNRIEEKAKEWNMKVDDAICYGCKSSQNAIYCRNCYFKKCAEAKKVGFCSQCNDYPCMQLREFKNDKFPHHSVVLKSLEAIKEKGYKQWLVDQEIRWKCKICGSRFAWYKDFCDNCGEELYNCVKEEMTLTD